MVTSAIKIVGSFGRQKLDWFLECEQLLAAKKHAWDQVLPNDSLYTCHRFRQCESAIKRAVADAKEDWIKNTAEAANVDQDGQALKTS